jgi:diguanylate cyclase (GGDEF)-like protein
VLETLKVEDEVIGLRLDGREFLAEDETGQVFIPKALLKGFRLSDIPEELLIKPVNSIRGNVIELEQDILVGAFRDGRAAAEVEDMGRRKLWDGEVGFSKFMGAMRQAVQERAQTLGDVSERVFDDDGDYIFLQYEVTLTEDMEIQEAVTHVESMIGELQARREQILARQTDGLLRILDRGSFDIDLSQLVETASKASREVSLILVDIDHFKAVNDAFGHQAGDEVLRTVAELAAEAAEGKGEAYRYGGEELAILLPGVGCGVAAAVADEVRLAVAQHEFDRGIRATLSCGVACFPIHSDIPEGLVASADKALYEAKHSGRNAVRIAVKG